MIIENGNWFIKGNAIKRKTIVDRTTSLKLKNSMSVKTTRGIGNKYMEKVERYFSAIMEIRIIATSSASFLIFPGLFLVIVRIIAALKSDNKKIVIIELALSVLY